MKQQHLLFSLIFKKLVIVSGIIIGSAQTAQCTYEEFCAAYEQQKQTLAPALFNLISRADKCSDQVALYPSTGTSISLDTVISLVKGSVDHPRCSNTDSLLENLHRLIIEKVRSIFSVGPEGCVSPVSRIGLLPENIFNEIIFSVLLFYFIASEKVLPDFITSISKLHMALESELNSIKHPFLKESKESMEIVLFLSLGLFIVLSNKAQKIHSLFMISEKESGFDIFNILSREFLFFTGEDDLIVKLLKFIISKLQKTLSTEHSTSRQSCHQDTSALMASATGPSTEATFTGTFSPHSRTSVLKKPINTKDLCSGSLASMPCRSLVPSLSLGGMARGSQERSGSGSTLVGVSPSGVPSGSGEGSSGSEQVIQPPAVDLANAMVQTSQPETTAFQVESTASQDRPRLPIPQRRGPRERPYWKRHDFLKRGDHLSEEGFSKVIQSLIDNHLARREQRAEERRKARRIREDLAHFMKKVGKNPDFQTQEDMEDAEKAYHEVMTANDLEEWIDKSPNSSDYLGYGD